MVQLWVVIGLAISAACVSTLGAAFSIMGLGKLFTGAVVAVWLMAGSLELAKFVIAAFLHQVWSRLHILFKSYLLMSVVVLSAITSMGIFGFLSSAYQESSSVLEGENIRLEALKAEGDRDTQEIARLIKEVDDIPASRVSKKLALRAAAEPQVQALKKQIERIASEVTTANLKILETKEKVGPLIYIARAFHQDIDTVVKYLIMVFVSVFDPLAICLVVALSESFRMRSQARKEAENAPEQAPVLMQPAEDSVIQMRFSKEAEASGAAESSDPQVESKTDPEEAAA